MQLTLQRHSFTNAFQTVAGAVPSKTTKDILKNVKLQVSRGTLTLLGTDSEIGLRCDVPDVDCDTPGEALLPTSRLLAILRELTDDVLKLEITADAIWIRCGYSEFRLSATDPADFPPVAVFQEDDYYVIPAPVLRQLVRRSIFATDTESTRYALGGVQAEFTNDKAIFAATDSRRLAVVSGALKIVGKGQADNVSKTPPVIPSKAMTLIERNLTDDKTDAHIAIHPNDIAVRIGSVTITSQLVQGRFPDWRKVVPTKFSATIPMVVAPIYGAIRQSMIVTSEDSRGVDFTFTNGTLKLSSQTADIGQSRIELPIQYESKESLKCTFDPRYIADFLKVLDPATSIDFKLISHEDPAVLTADGYTYVVMPLSRDR